MGNTLKRRDTTQEDFEVLFQEFSNVVYRLCLYKTGNTETAEDLTQETFLRLWRTISSGSHITNPKAYMYQITRNLIVDHYTVRKNVSLEVLQEDGFDPVSEDAQPDIVAEASLLRGAIESLDADYRQAVYLSFVEGLRVKDIAEILGVSENLISVRINRGKKKLRERFT